LYRYAVTGNRWSGDAHTRPGYAAEVAFALAANKDAAMHHANVDGSLTAAKIQRSLREEETPGGAVQVEFWGCSS
jgi:hypothetical protein